MRLIEMKSSKLVCFGLSLGLVFSSSGVLATPTSNTVNELERIVRREGLCVSMYKTKTKAIYEGEYVNVEVVDKDGISSIVVFGQNAPTALYEREFEPNNEGVLPSRVNFSISDPGISNMYVRVMDGCGVTSREIVFIDYTTQKS